MILHPPFPSPPEATSPDDHNVPIAVGAPRLDLSDAGSLSAETPQGRSQGPRQRRFEFDAKVIRDTLVRKLRSAEREDLAAPIDNCHRDAVYKRCCGCRHVKTFYNRCERFYCPICAARLARDRREAVGWWSKVISQPKHVVLTVRSVPVLTKEYIRNLKDDFRRLRSQQWAKDGKFLWRATAVTPSRPNDEPVEGASRPRGKLSVWRGRKLGNKTSKWLGGFWSLDVTLNPSGWHVHFHAIVNADFIDLRELDERWAALRGQDMAVVRVYDVHAKDYVAEACKYVCDGVQIGTWPAEKLVEFCDSLREERCFDTFGCLYKQRAEWTAAMKEIHEDRAVCECGCRKWEFFDASEWEWQQTKSSLAPPSAAPVRVFDATPDMFPVTPGLVK